MSLIPNKPEPGLFAAHPPVVVGRNTLTTVLRRLEAATSRLEDIASSSVGIDGSTTAGTAPGSVAGIATPPEAPTPKPVDTLPEAIQAYDDIVSNDLQAWLDLSSKLGDAIDGQVLSHVRSGRHGG